MVVPEIAIRDSKEVACTIAIYFRSNINPNFIKDALIKAKFTEIKISQPTVETPTAMVAPFSPEIGSVLFRKDNTLVAFTNDRFDIKGSLNEILRIFEGVIAALRNKDIDISKGVRYFEFHIPAVAEKVPNFLTNLRSNSEYKKLHMFRQVFDEEMNLYGIWLSNPESPLADNWMRITLQPDLYRGNDYVIMDILKRSASMGEMTKFLKDIDLRRERLVRILREK